MRGKSTYSIFVYTWGFFVSSILSWKHCPGLHSSKNIFLEQESISKLADYRRNALGFM